MDIQETTVKIHPDGSLIISTPEGWMETDLRRENISRPPQERVDEATEVDPVHLAEVWADWVAQDRGDADLYDDDDDAGDDDAGERLAELLGRERLRLGGIAGQWWLPHGALSKPIPKREQQAEEELRSLLAAISALDPSAPGAGTQNEYLRYQIRNRLILQAVGAAATAGEGVGISYDPAEPDYPIVVVLRLSTGQVTWHLPSWGPWDGHDTATKYRRVRDYLAYS